VCPFLFLVQNLFAPVFAWPTCRVNSNIHAAPLECSDSPVLQLIPNNPGRHTTDLGRYNGTRRGRNKLCLYEYFRVGQLARVARIIPRYSIDSIYALFTKASVGVSGNL